MITPPLVYIVEHHMPKTISKLKDAAFMPGAGLIIDWVLRQFPDHSENALSVRLEDIKRLL
jgi:hypothetical protein